MFDLNKTSIQELESSQTRYNKITIAVDINKNVSIIKADETNHTDKSLSDHDYFIDEIKHTDNNVFETELEPGVYEIEWHMETIEGYFDPDEYIPVLNEKTAVKIL